MRPSFSASCSYILRHTVLMPDSFPLLGRSQFLIGYKTVQFLHGLLINSQLRFLLALIPHALVDHLFFHDATLFGRFG